MSALRRFTVCVSAEYDDVEIEAERFFYSQDTGWLVFSNAGMPVHVYAPGKWTSFSEVLP
jgi:hypothetical protein